MITISHIIVFTTKSYDYFDAKERFFEPFITIFLLNYLFWDIFISPFVSLVFLCMRPGKNFYEKMISSRLNCD
jgi:hypothetical protein